MGCNSDGGGHGGLGRPSTAAVLDSSMPLNDAPAQNGGFTKKQRTATAAQLVCKHIEGLGTDGSGSTSPPGAMVLLDGSGSGSGGADCCCNTQAALPDASRCALPAASTQPQLQLLEILAVQSLQHQTPLAVGSIVEAPVDSRYQQHCSFVKPLVRIHAARPAAAPAQQPACRHPGHTWRSTQERRETCGPECTADGTSRTLTDAPPATPSAIAVHPAILPVKFAAPPKAAWRGLRRAQDGHSNTGHVKSCSSNQSTTAPPVGRAGAHPALARLLEDQHASRERATAPLAPVAAGCRMRASAPAGVEGQGTSHCVPGGVHTFTSPSRHDSGSSSDERGDNSGNEQDCCGLQGSQPQPPTPLWPYHSTPRHAGGTLQKHDESELPELGSEGKAGSDGKEGSNEPNDEKEGSNSQDKEGSNDCSEKPNEPQGCGRDNEEGSHNSQADPQHQQQQQAHHAQQDLLRMNNSKRARLVWTPELHQRFMSAVQHLGAGNCVPKTILQLMNVDGMTRENVASHLQKYRQTLRKGSSGSWESSTPLNLLDQVSDQAVRALGSPSPPSSATVLLQAVAQPAALLAQSSHTLPNNQYAFQQQQQHAAMQQAAAVVAAAAAAAATAASPYDLVGLMSQGPFDLRNFSPFRPGGSFPPDLSGAAGRSMDAINRQMSLCKEAVQRHLHMYGPAALSRGVSPPAHAALAAMQQHLNSSSNMGGAGPLPPLPTAQPFGQPLLGYADGTCGSLGTFPSGAGASAGGPFTFPGVSAASHHLHHTNAANLAMAGVGVQHLALLHQQQRYLQYGLPPAAAALMAAASVGGPNGASGLSAQQQPGMIAGHAAHMFAGLPPGLANGLQAGMPLNMPLGLPPGMPAGLPPLPPLQLQPMSQQPQQPTGQLPQAQQYQHRQH